MKKTRMVLVMLAGMLTLCTLTGCELPEGSESTSSTEGTAEMEQADSIAEEIVEEVIEQVVVDEDADGQENGISQEIVIP